MLLAVQPDLPVPERLADEFAVMRRGGIVVGVGPEVGARDAHLADGDLLAFLQRHDEPDERAMQIDLLSRWERTSMAIAGTCF